MKTALVVKIVLFYSCCAIGHLVQRQDISNDTHSEQLQPSYNNGYNTTASSACSLNTNSLCPPWFYCQSETCFSGPSLPWDVLSIDKREIFDGNCVTYNELEDSSEVGNCRFNHVNTSTESGILANIYNELPSNVSDLNKMFCNRFNRQGIHFVVSVKMATFHLFIPLTSPVSSVHTARPTGSSIYYWHSYHSQYFTLSFCSSK